jgi:hypothetical protein
MPGKGKPFVPGDPRAGRPPGVPNKTGRDARELAQKLVTDPEYVEGLRDRLIGGKLGNLEGILWAYAFGPPPSHPITALSEALENLPLQDLPEPYHPLPGDGRRHESNHSP